MGALIVGNSLKEVRASIVSGGGFFALKGLAQDQYPRQMTVLLHQQRAFGRAIRCSRSADRIFSRSNRNRKA
jgi:hypothetical protein